MSFFNFRNRSSRRDVREQRSVRSRSRKLRLEALEDRRVLATFTVDDNLADCPSANFTTIQAAVAAADDNDKIIVCKGTYTGPVVIPASKDDLELRSKNTLQAHIVPPAGPVASEPTPFALVHVDGADDVEIIGFTIGGTIDLTIDPPPTPPALPDSGIYAGIFVGNGGSAEIERNHITEILEVGGEGTGIGILVGQGSTGQIGEAEIKKNTVDNYHRIGILIDNDGSEAEVEDNDVVGRGPTADVPQTGIQISNGAKAEVENNDVSDHQFLGSDLGAGILLSFPGKTTVKNNDVEDNDVGIEAQNVSKKVEISHNDVSDSIVDGIGLIDSTKVEISNNEVEDSGENGLYVENSFKNTIRNNEFQRNGFNGIVLISSNDNRISDNELKRNSRHGLLVEDSNDNRISDNESDRNTLDGFRVTGTSANNRLTSNEADNNDEHDCHDDTVGGETLGTANIWKNNEGDSSLPGGLCS